MPSGPIILMTAPIILPPLKPPVELDIFVVKNIAPDIVLADVIGGVLPFVILMALAVVMHCVLPEIAMWPPEAAIKTVR